MPLSMHGVGQKMKKCERAVIKWGTLALFHSSHFRTYSVLLRLGAGLAEFILNKAARLLIRDLCQLLTQAAAFLVTMTTAANLSHPLEHI